MTCFSKFYKKEKLISRTLEIDEELYYELEKLSSKVYDASISKLVNAAIENLIQTENIQVYKRKNTSSRSFLIRRSFLEGLYNLKKKYRIPIYLLVNIAIRNVLIEEMSAKRQQSQPNQQCCHWGRRILTLLKLKKK